MRFTTDMGCRYVEQEHEKKQTIQVSGALEVHYSPRNFE